jgi:predicted ATP-dependent Lon-type protease
MDMVLSRTILNGALGAALVLKFDLVTFDEVAGGNFKLEGNREMRNGYVVKGSFLKGDDHGRFR